LAVPLITCDISFTQQTKEINNMDAWEQLKSLGIQSSWRNEHGTVMVETCTNEVRPATNEETKLHEQAVYEYHMEEAQAGLI
jgi:hypothetical protein